MTRNENKWGQLGELLVGMWCEMGGEGRKGMHAKRGKDGTEDRWFLSV